MTESKRILLVLEEPKDGTKILLEIADSKERDVMREQAKAFGLNTTIIGLEEYDRMTYRGCRYFDLRNSFTLENFKIDNWMEFLKHWEEHERDDEFGEYRM